MATRTHTPLIDIAETMVALAHRLSEQASLAIVALPPAFAATQPMSPTEHAAKILHDRRRRREFLPATLFHEPAWEVLLALYVAGERADPISLKQVSLEVDAPFTTTQRWVDQLVAMRLLARTDSEHDRRRVELSLTPMARAGLDGYFAAVAQPG